MAISEKWLYCNECKEIFERADLERGEDGDEEICPCCGSYQVCNCDECELCGEPVIEGELKDDAICEDCLTEYRYDYKTMKKVSQGYMEKEEIEINSLLAHYFKPSEIEDILFEVLEKRMAEGNTLDGYSYMARDKSEYCGAVYYLLADERKAKRDAEDKRAS